MVCSVLEWTGDCRNEMRSAQIQLQFDDERCSLVMMSHAKSVLRVVDFLRHDKLLIWASSDKQRNHLLIHVPREYDLVRVSFSYRFSYSIHLSDRVTAIKVQLLRIATTITKLILILLLLILNCKYNSMYVYD